MNYRKIGIYGTGKVATSFGNHLTRIGYEVGYYGRSTERLQSRQKMVFHSWNSIVAWSDVLGFIVTDSAISQVSRTAYESVCSSVSRDDLPTVFHMSGALDVGALEGDWPCRFTLHPLRAFASFVPDMNDTVFVLERQNQTNSIELSKQGEAIRLFVDSLQGKVLEISSIHKTKYHAAAVIASNFMVSVMHLAKSYLSFSGISDETVLWPLVDSTIENMKHLGIDHALTGPVNRGDLETIRKHIGSLREEDKALYVLLSKQALDLSQADESAKREMRIYLEEVLRQQGNGNRERFV